MKKRASYGLQPIENKISRLLKPIFQGSKKEFILINNLSTNWEEVIGKKYHKFCYPKSVSFNQDRTSKLTIAVYNPAVGFFLENNSEIIIERIASFYGFKSISRLIIRQEPKDIGNSIKKEIKLPKEKEHLLQKTISNIKDKDLAHTLEKLGKEIYNDKNHL